MATRKLPPPIIEGVIPASYGSRIIIPYQMNRSVGKGEFIGFKLKIKTVQSNMEINTLVSYNFTDVEVEFDLPVNANGKPTLGLQVGQFYKVQLAYIYRNNNGDKVEGYYSTISVMKYTAEPVLTIRNEGDGEYLGIYTTDDPTEKVYSYSFELVDDKGKIITSTGELIHNSYEDTEVSTSMDRFVLNKELKNNSTYYLRYSVVTNNKIKISVNSQTIIKQDGIASALAGATIIPTMNKEEGYVDISLKGAITETETGPVEKAVVGNFSLLRASNEDNYETWYEVVKFDLFGQQPTRHLWDDMTITQGVSYKYAIQQYNTHGVKSEKLISEEEVHADFEHAFLYDGERQLKIKYNPKISSFKNTLQEAKVETIGSKFPFIFRNGNINYKEFPISGLISYHSDENDLFWSGKPAVFDGNRGEAITAPLPADLNDISLERKFKLEVLEWLTNGKPKLFKSPMEGNYVVRLMNVTLQPNDTLGRMLHTFNCTAYEIADSSYEHLLSYGFIKTAHLSEKQLRWSTVELKTFDIETNVLSHEAVSILIESMQPGSKITLYGPSFADEKMDVTIGSTGAYSIDLKQNISITKITLPQKTEGLLTYAYYSDEFHGNFDMVTEVASVDVPSQQFIGKHENILDLINNIKNEIGTIGLLRFYLRPAESVVFKFGNEYYTDLDKTTQIYINSTLDLYQVYFKTETIIHKSTNETINVFKEGDMYYNNIYHTGIIDINRTGYNYDIWEYEWYDGYNDVSLGTECLPKYASIRINDAKYDINIMDTTLFYYPNPQDITSISIGGAVVCEITYRKKVITYEIEEENMIKNSEEHVAYNDAKEDMDLIIKTDGATSNQILTAKRACIEAYNNYLALLESTLKQMEAN